MWIEQIHRQATGDWETPDASLARKRSNNKRGRTNTVPHHLRSAERRAALRHAFPRDVNDICAGPPPFTPLCSMLSSAKSSGMK
nr:hypothetical protein FNV92_22220 [Bradyrhizobium cosmicum]